MAAFVGRGSTLGAARIGSCVMPNIAAKHYLQQRDLHFQAVTGTGPWVT